MYVKYFVSLLMYVYMQKMKSSRDNLIKDLDAKNAEMSDMMTKAKEHLDKITAEKDKLEIEYTELKKSNTVSICMYQHVHCRNN